MMAGLVLAICLSWPVLVWRGMRQHP